MDLMMSALLIAGAVAALAGLGAIALGIPVKEFSFGNTMILSGSMGVCTGLILFGLSMVLGELRVIAHRLRLRVASETNSKALQLPGDETENPPADIAAGPVEDVWREGSTPRGRGRQSEFRTLPPAEFESEAEPDADPIAPEPASKPKRNLLFATASRKERERAEKEKWATDTPAGEFRSSPLGETDFGEQPMADPVVPGAPPMFEDSWPKPERIRPPEPPPLRRAARAAPAFGDPASRPARNNEPPAVNVIKSGVVDGMAYSLYSDGSIEAQMPEGMMRFGSIDQLRSHLDRRG
jgi:hypothetical protein